jgi:hypothetical protein
MNTRVRCSTRTIFALLPGKEDILFSSLRAMRETFARALAERPRAETRSTRSGPSGTRRSKSSTTGSNRLVLTVGYSEVGAFAEVLQSTGEYVDGRVVRRTAGEGLESDS